MECMALKPLYQQVSEQCIVHSTIGVITNVREDHQDVMGETLPEIARSLAETCPVRGILVTAEQEPALVNVLRGVADSRGSSLIVCNPRDVTEADLARFDHIAFKDNLAVGLEVAKLLGVPREVALAGMARALPDAGAVKVRQMAISGKDVIVVPDERRRINEAWQAFRRLEAQDPAAAARAWPSLWAVYPELQDWQARRGHGGANSWDPVASPSAIQSAATGEGPVIVQFHGGFEYMPWKSDYIAQVSREAIDAGADLVIAHHPHVLQGFEWYRGSLIAYSMGNLAFDQDTLPTKASGFLRTVWEGDRLLEARFVPVVLKEYRPLPVAGVTASRLLRDIAQRSLAPVMVGRLPNGSLGFRATETPPEGSPSFRIERNTLVIEAPGSSPSQTGSVLLDPGRVIDLDANGLYRVSPSEVSETLAVGVNRFPYGTFDDAWAGGSGALFWDLKTQTSVVEGGRNDGNALQLKMLPGRTTLVRPVGRIALFDPLVTLPDFRAAWLRADFELRLWVRVDEGASVSVRLDFYAFDDTDSTKDPVSEQLASQTFAIAAGADSAWREVRLALQPPPQTTHVLPYVLGTSDRPARALIDDVELIEWRAATGSVALFVAADHLLNRGETEQIATFERKPLYDAPRVATHASER